MLCMKHRHRRRADVGGFLFLLPSGMRRLSRKSRRMPHLLRALAALAAFILLTPGHSWGKPGWPNGNLDGAQYLPRLPDPLEGTFESPSWDVQGVYFDLSRQWLYVGVDTVAVFDRNGADSSPLGQTVVSMEFKEVPAGATQTVRLVLTDTTAEVTIDDQPVPYSSLAWRQCHVYTGTDLEVTIGRGLLDYFVLDALSLVWCGPDERMTVAGELDFRLVLSDGGPGPHDGVVGRLPEPGSLLLLALGSPIFLRRRRRWVGRRGRWPLGRPGSHVRCGGCRLGQ